MFVFTVSCDETQNVYVGSAKESIEAQWAAIVAAADEGQEGALQAAIRLHGVEKFTVEEWAFAENSRELRELLAEARDALGAKPIKLLRGSDAAVKRSGATQVSSDIRELFSMAKAEYESELVEELIPAESLEKKSKVTTSETPSSKKNELPTSLVGAAESSEKLSSGRSGSASKEKRIKEAIHAEREQRAVLRQQQASQEAKEMQAILLQIEQRRLAQKKKPTSKSTKSKSSLRSAVSSKPPKSAASSAAGSKAASAKTASRKSTETNVAVAKGRTGSSLKEKRIKEAIAQEKAAIEAAKRQQAESQADEMAAILNRLDERNKAAASYKRKL
ncbi:hypothetical protein [Pseudoteredinibacter isoporae]|uniref:Colicin import membrane protein n=1 Tax=Pseudoteredinibacter isoporae TaxID=570281 RepID=A0A7X0JSU6_9GAMM|nr:hypothetical protein [Pseudoteredinibacter isoporae]MBB6520780.1 colicin import membrane protein [Pseudoteredinibacter isoporae]NHO86346.1 hypothetical protein [Pseudoteredinibacter isoporae]NIB25202.1 hypothetical protein [Pseudoteredinibacter isoporae]